MSTKAEVRERLLSYLNRSIESFPDEMEGYVLAKQAAGDRWTPEDQAGLDRLMRSAAEPMFKRIGEAADEHPDHQGQHLCAT